MGRTHSFERLVTLKFVAAAAALLLGTDGAFAVSPMSQISGEAEAFQLISGLQGPDGMAFHPETGELYVAEREAGRISVIRDGKRTTVIEAGFTVTNDIPAWAMSRATELKSREALTEGKLKSPTSVDFSPDGRLYVAERREYGRVLEFVPDEKGAYTTASLIPVPWIEKPFAWDDLKVSKNGQLFVVGYDQKGEGTLHFGTVMVRAADGNWWVIDYGPFSSFSAIYLSRNHDILVVCERSKGEIVAWDLVRHMPIGTVPESVFQAEAESVCLLKDGSYVVAEVPTADQVGLKGKGRLVRVDPVTAQATGFATGFDRLGSVVMDPKTGYLYATDAEAGLIAELRPDKKSLSDDYLLQRSLEAFESSSGFSPRVAPVFLKNFLTRLGGTQTGDSRKPGGDEQGQPVSEDVVFGSTFTLREFATRIPMVAGKVRTLLDGTEKEKNPVVEIDFLLFFPSHVVKGTDMATPSLSFFRATHKDKSVTQSRLLFNNLHATQRVGDQWLLQTDSASLYVPLATCGMERNDDGMDLNLAFLGMGVYDDYYLRLTTGKENKGSLMVEGKYGGSSEYKLSFVDKPQYGAEPVKNLVVAGFDPAVKGEDLGWLEIGRLPVGSALALGEQEVQRFAALDEEITSQIEKKELERRLESGADAEEMGEEGDAEGTVPVVDGDEAAGEADSGVAPPAEAPAEAPAGAGAETASP